MGHLSPNHQWDQCRHRLFPLNPVRARGTSISLRVLYRSLLLHKEAMVWAEAEDKAHKPRLQGFRGVSMPSHHRLSQLISRFYRLCLCYHTHHIFFVATSSVDVLGLELETLDEPLHVSSPLGTKVRIDKICRDCELEISGILLTMDLR